MTDLFVKTTNRNQFLDPSFSHHCHYKKEIPYSQAVRLNDSFGKRYNDLEGWLMERGYNRKMIWKQVLKVQEHTRKDLLEREKTETSKTKLTFNITYYPVFSKH